MPWSLLKSKLISLVDEHNKIFMLATFYRFVQRVLVLSKLIKLWSLIDHNTGPKFFLPKQLHFWSVSTFLFLFLILSKSRLVSFANANLCCAACINSFSFHSFESPSVTIVSMKHENYKSSMQYHHIHRSAVCARSLQTNTLCLIAVFKINNALHHWIAERLD